MSYDLCFLDYIIDYGHGPVRVTEPVVPHECLNAALARRFGLKQMQLRLVRSWGFDDDEVIVSWLYVPPKY